MRRGAHRNAAPAQRRGRDGRDPPRGIMKWDLGRPNPSDPWTRFRCFKWLVTRRLAEAIARTSPYARGRLLDVGCGNNRRFAGYFKVETYTGLEYPTTLGSDASPVDVFGTALALP